jgi:2-phospho-L-lactate guanylyltransferase
MTLWAIVPVKPLTRGKSRLAQVLNRDQRTQLNEFLLQNTIHTLSTIREIDNILVVSRDQSALAMARDLGAKTVLENGAPQLNIALTRATVVAKSYATRAVLILPADLPLVTREDIDRMLAHLNSDPVVVVAPDRHHRGTNALLVSPPGLMEYQYGDDSFARHCQMAKEAGARLEICELPSLSLDLDLPEDLALLEQELNFDIYQNLYHLEE